MPPKDLAPRDGVRILQIHLPVGSFVIACGKETMTFSLSIHRRTSLGSCCRVGTECRFSVVQHVHCTHNINTPFKVDTRRPQLARMRGDEL